MDVHTIGGHRPPLWHRPHRFLALTACLLAGFSDGAAAQGVGSATVLGTVRTTEGEPVAEASVVLLRPSTGQRFSVESDERGGFAISLVPPGAGYSLQVEAMGFALFEVTDLTLSVGEERVIDPVLGATPLELEGIAVQVERDSRIRSRQVGPASVFGPTELRAIPTVSRSPIEAARFSAMVKTTPLGVSVAGQNDRFNTVLVDGVLSQDLFGITPGGIPGGRAGAEALPLDAVQELEVLSAPFDVRYSGFSGGALNLVTRRGTTTWDGDLYGEYRGPSLSGTTEVQGSPVDGADVTRRLIAGSVGGPVWEDRAFLFLSGELESEERTPDGLNLGREDDVLVRIHPDSAARFESILKNRYRMHPGDAGPVILERQRTNLFGRLDLILGEGASLTARYHLADAGRDAGPNRGPTGPYEYSSNGVRYEGRSQGVSVTLSGPLPARLRGELTASYRHLRDTTRPESDDPQVEVLLESALAGTRLDRELRAGGNAAAGDQAVTQDAIELRGTVAGVLGAHRFTFGAGVELLGLDYRFDPVSGGRWRFESLEALETDSPLLFERSLNTVGGARAEMDMGQWSVFGQDAIQLTDGAILTLGLRLDAPWFGEGPPHNPTLEEALGIRTRGVPSGSPVLSPRVSLDWRVSEAWGTRLRGGAGIFVGRLPGLWVSESHLNPGLEGRLLRCSGGNAPGMGGGGLPESCGPGTPDGIQAPSVVAVGQGAELPRDLRLAAGADQPLPGRMVLSIDLLFTRALSRPRVTDANLPDPISDPQPDDGYSEGYGDRSNYGVPEDPAFTGRPFAPLRRADEFGTVLVLDRGDEDYGWSVAGELRGRPWETMGFQLAYSYARSYDRQSLIYSDALSNLGAAPVGAVANEVPLAPSLFDRPHKLGALVWFQPLGSRIGTTVSVAYVGQSGRPYSYVYRGDVNGDGFSGSGAVLDRHNDLIQVPAGISDIPGSIGTAGLLDGLVNREKCLYVLRGQLSQRNLCREPWSGRLDLRLAHPVQLGGTRWEIGLDLINAGNLLGTSHGAVETVREVVDVLAADRRARVFPGDGPNPTGDLRVRYVGAVSREGTGIRSALPRTVVVAESIWQARFGLRIAF